MSATQTSVISLVIVDDHEVTRIGLRTLLESCAQFAILGEARSVAEALAAVERFQPRLVLLDLRLPDGSGIELCRRLKRQNEDTKVLVLTSYSSDDLIFDAIAAGANGYLLKEIHAETLIRAIQDVAAGQSILDPVITGRVMQQVRDGVAPVVETKLDVLSAQERRVVALVAEGKTNKEIGREMGLSDKTVKNYLSSAMEKLNLNRRSHAAAFFITQTQHNLGAPLS